MPKKTTSIRIDPQVLEEAQKRFKELGFASLSEYVSALFLIDCDQRPTLHTVRDQSGAKYFNSAPPRKTGNGKKKKVAKGNS